MTPHLWVCWSVQPMRSELSENWPIGAAHTMLVPQTGVIASGWTSQCLILQKGECHSWTLEWRGSVRRVSLNKKTFIRISCEEIRSDYISGDLMMAKSVKVVNKVVNMEKNAAVGQEENFATTALTSTSTSLSSAYSSILQATSLHLIWLLSDRSSKSDNHKG